MWRKLTLGMLMAALVVPIVALHSASALTVSPIILDMELAPGDAIVGTIKIHNEGESTETYTPVVEDFVAADDTGTPSFVGKASTRSLVNWITFQEPSFTLESSETKHVIYNIVVPQNAAPGGYFGGMLFNSGTTEVGQGVGVTAATGPLVLIRIAGDAVEAGSVTEFTVTPESATSLPVNFGVRFQNTGNVHVKPSGVIRVTNMFGGTAGIIPVNAEGGNVLPDSVRSFDASWAKKDLPAGASELVQEWQNYGFGPYTATLIMNYGDSNQVVTATTSFWIMPWLLVVLFLILVVILVLLVMQYNKWLLAKHGTGAKRKK